MKRFLLIVAAAAVPLSMAVSYAAADATATTRPAVAAPEKTTTPPSASPQTDWFDAIKQPCPNFKWGADLRLRQEFYKNDPSLNNNADNEASYQRYRARAWYSILPTADISFNNRWVWEGRYYWQPDAKEGWDDSYIIADQLNMQFRKLGGADATLTVGRQDLFMGDGWMVMDGTPLDGSRTLFLDGVRAEIGLKDIQSKLDLSYVVQHSAADAWSPIIGDPKADWSTTQDRLVEQNEQGAILDFTNKSVEDLTLDGFFIWKHDDAQVVNGDNGDIYALGGRAEKKWDEHWSGRAAGAYEFGKKQNDVLYPEGGDLSAYGVNSRLSYAFNDSMKNQLNLDFEFLSGDNPSTSNVEAFDTLWGRWPRFSELYAVLQASDTRPADYTNLYRVGPSYQVQPTSQLRFDLAYYALFADQHTYDTPAFGDGYFRGHLLQAIARYQFNSHVSGHLWGEYFIPGDFYSSSRQDNAVFLRAELNFAL